MIGVEHAHELASANAAARTLWVRAAIVVAYVALFWLALPWLLWQLGMRFDHFLALGRAQAEARWVGLGLGIASTLLLIAAMLTLVRVGHGLPISHLPPRELVRSGGYARARHPIYLWFTLSWLGWSLWLGSWGAAVGGGCVLLLAWIAYAKLLEEPALYRRFGESYARYARSTQLLPIIPAFARELALRAWLACLPAVERLANHTTLYRAKRLSFVTYGAFVGAAAWWLVLYGCAALIAQGGDPSRVLGFGVCASLATLLGGRLAGIAYRARLLLHAPKRALRTIGFVSFGGYAGLLLSACVAAPWLALPTGALLDRLVLPALLASALGRLGCLSYGCCAGRAWQHGICVYSADARITRELGAHAQQPRMPTQLLSCLHALVLALVLFVLGCYPLPAGALSAMAALLYGLGRLTIEHTREEARFLRLALTRGQLAAFALVVIGVSVCLLIDPSAGYAPVVRHIPWSAWRMTLPTACACGVLSALVTGVHGTRIGYW